MPLMTGAPPSKATAEQRASLEHLARSMSLPHRTVIQARTLLLVADGVATNEVARRLDTTDDSARALAAAF